MINKYQENLKWFFLGPVLTTMSINIEGILFQKKNTDTTMLSLFLSFDLSMGDTQSWWYKKESVYSDNS